MAWAVKFENVRKRYRRGGATYATLRDDLVRLAQRAGASLRGRAFEDVGTLALDGLSFEVGEGEAFALIGPNGAGKTTALKLLTRICYPTSGRIRVRGRVGALIEVGSGVHPELTGRENIWLYGRIMGMSKREIARRFDEIVEFSELSHALDTPVKTYSSGMQLRLGFSIASHLDPDVFVVDEALAVGDAGFQAKCVERMTGLVREGHTLILVSHNLYAVEAMCPRALYLNRGAPIIAGGVKDVLARYLDDIDQHRLSSGETALRRFNGGPLDVAVQCTGPDGTSSLRTGEPLTIAFDVLATRPGLRAFFHLGITDGRPGGPLLLASQIIDGQEPVTLATRDRIECLIPDLPLLPRVYQVWGEVRGEHGWGNFISWQKLADFRVVRRHDDAASVSHEGTDAPVRVQFRFDHKSAPMDLVISHDNA